MRLLHAIRSVNPADGGPIETLLRRTEALEALGHDVTIVSLDAPGDSWVTNCPARPIALGPATGNYGYSRRLAPWLRSNLPGYDAATIHGLWQYHGYAVRQEATEARVPYFVFPHGMLDPWFKRKHPLKHLKKWLYWPWAEYRILRNAAAVLFTTDAERLLARESFWLYQAEEAVVNYGTAEPPKSTDAESPIDCRYPELRAKRLLVFLGRIHPKKGCDLLLESFAKTATDDDSLRLIMVGPGDSDYVALLQSATRRLGIDGRVIWTGLLLGAEKWDLLRRAEVFVLPSHQENFGVSVVEAMACGCPVLISTEVNIWREVEADGAGWAAPDTLAGTQALLENWFALDERSKKEAGRNARRCFEQRFHIDRAATSFLNVLAAHGVGEMTHV